MTLNELRLNMAELLGTNIINGKYFFMDYWSIIHLTVGFLIMFLIFKYFKKSNDYKKFIALFSLILFWEAYEFSVLWIKAEMTKDIVYDLVMGMLGGYIVYYLKKD